MDTSTLSAYEKHKPAIYKWRQLNREKYNKICNRGQVIYYKKNKDRISKYKKEYYLKKKAEKLSIEREELKEGKGE